MLNGRHLTDWFAALPERVSQMPAYWARRQPQALALIDDQAAWTYQQLATMIEHTAEWLYHLGLRPGQRLALLGENSRGLIALALAASELSLTTTILNARLAPGDLDHPLRHFAPHRLIAVGDSDAIAAHAVRLQLVGAECQHLGGIPLAISQAAAAEKRPSTPAAIVAYTSGTTGAPKGVELTPRNLAVAALLTGAARSYQPGDLIYGPGPIAHVSGLVAVTFAAFYHGAALRTTARFNPARAYAAFTQEQVTVMHGVPTMYASFLDYLVRTGAPMPPTSLRFVSSAGGVLRDSIKTAMESRLGVPVRNVYGLSETASAGTLPTLGQPAEVLGRPLPGTDVRIAPLPGSTGPEGVLYLRGPQVMAGYFDNPEATRAALSPDGWLNTGDLVTQDKDGCLRLCGRVKDIIIRGGVNIYPADIEAACLEHPDVTQVAILGRPLANGDEVIVAAVVRRPGSQLSARGLKRFLAERLSTIKQPGEVHFIEALPMTSSGKLIRHVLQQQLGF